jgi:hypothetical protein
MPCVLFHLPAHALCSVSSAGSFGRFSGVWGNLIPFFLVFVPEKLLQRKREGVFSRFSAFCTPFFPEAGVQKIVFALKTPICFEKSRISLRCSRKKGTFFQKCSKNAHLLPVQSYSDIHLPPPGAA